MKVFLVAFGTVVVLWAAAIAALFFAGKRSSARELATFVPNLVFLFRGLLKDPDVPRRTKMWLAVGVIWIVSPLDLIPEFIPVLGPLDDAVIAAIVLRHVVRTAGHGVIARHWRGEEASLRVLLRVSGADGR